MSILYNSLCTWQVCSRNPESILNETVAISKKGFKEIVLTGIHIASYGKDFDKDEVKNIEKNIHTEQYKLFDPKDDLATGYDLDLLNY